jgi:hypothetical protein
MQHKVVIAGLIAAGLATSALAADVGVAVNVNVPGVYGEISIGGGVAAPELLLPRPTVVVQTPVAVGVPPPAPLYLHVPTGYERHWAVHCHEYHACNRPVYFVSEHWYHDVYTPHHMMHHEEERRALEHREMEHREAVHREVEHHEAEHRQEEHHIEHEREHEHDRDHDRDH